MVIVSQGHRQYQKTVVAVASISRSWQFTPNVMQYDRCSVVEMQYVLTANLGGKRHCDELSSARMNANSRSKLPVSTRNMSARHVAWSAAARYRWRDRKASDRRHRLKASSDAEAYLFANDLRRDFSFLRDCWIRCCSE